MIIQLDPTLNRSLRHVAFTAAFVAVVIAYSTWIWWTFPDINVGRDEVEAKALLAQRGEVSIQALANSHPDNTSLQLDARLVQVLAEAQIRLQKVRGEIEAADGNDDWPSFDAMDDKQLNAFIEYTNTAARKVRMASVEMTALSHDLRERIRTEARHILGDRGASSFLSGAEKGAAESSTLNEHYFGALERLYNSLNDLAHFLRTSYGTYHFENAVWNFQNAGDLTEFRRLYDAVHASQAEYEQTAKDLASSSKRNLEALDRRMHGQP